MLDQDRLENLQQDCSNCARSNWDGSVTVSQDEHGQLTFTLLDEEGDESAKMEARPYGEAMAGQDLWKFVLEGMNYGEGTEPVGTLVPKMICGLLGL